MALSGYLHQQVVNMTEVLMTESVLFVEKLEMIPRR